MYTYMIYYWHVFTCLNIWKSWYVNHCCCSRGGQCFLLILASTSSFTGVLPCELVSKWGYPNLWPAKKTMYSMWTNQHSVVYHMNSVVYHILRILIHPEPIQSPSSSCFQKSPSHLLHGLDFLTDSRSSGPALHSKRIFLWENHLYINMLYIPRGLRPFKNWLVHRCWYEYFSVRGCVIVL